MSASTSTRAMALSCSGPYTAPVGFDGELSMMPRVRGVIARRKASGSSMKPDCSEHGTNFASAPASETIAAKLTHAGRRDDHLVAFVEQRVDYVGLGLLASGRRDYLARLVVEVIVALEFELDRIFERRGSAHRRVLGLARGERLVGGVLDALGSVEVGLAGGQRDDVDAGELHFGGARVGSQRGGRFDGGDSAIELQHFLNPDFE